MFPYVKIDVTFTTIIEWKEWEIDIHVILIYVILYFVRCFCLKSIVLCYVIINKYKIKIYFIYVCSIGCIRYVTCTYFSGNPILKVLAPDICSITYTILHCFSKISYEFTDRLRFLKIMSCNLHKAIYDSKLFA